jgi:uncharacterized membrane protein
MSKIDFINDLRHRLRRLPDEEIENAISYYEEYLNDAGVEREEETIRALGTPEAVASKIIGEYALNDAKPEPKIDTHKSKGLSPMMIAFIELCASPFAVIFAFFLVIMLFPIMITSFSLVIAGVIVAVVGGIITVFSIWVFISCGFVMGLLFLGIGMFLLALGGAMSLSTFMAWRFVYTLFQKIIGHTLIKRGRRDAA